MFLRTAKHGMRSHCAICILITLVEHFSGGKELNTELRTCLLPFVDGPPLSVIVRMDVRVGEFYYVCMAQARKGAKDEGVTVNALSLIHILHQERTFLM